MGRIAAALMMCLVLPTTDAFAERVFYLALTNDLWQVWSIRPDGRDAVQVTDLPIEVVKISCFPEGERLLANTNQGVLGMINTRDGGFVELPWSPPLVLDAAASPDGDAVVFSFSRAGSVDANDLYIANVNGANFRKVVGMPALQHEPAWSSDGNWIYFLSGDGGAAHDIWRLRLSDFSTEQLTVGSRYNFDVDVGSNDEFVFSSNRSGDYEIWKARPNQAAQRLTIHDGFDGKPRFSPDRERIVFERADAGLPSLWILSLRNGKERRLTNPRQQARAPVWCSGGRS